jgi:hypothetical protein
LLADGPRAVLDGLIARGNDDYSSISKLIGRNAAYIQQFIKRGTPRVLNEIDRGVIARYFGIEETLLGAPAHQGKTGGLVQIPMYDLDASAGAGSFHDTEAIIGGIGFDRSWLRKLTSSDPASLSLIRVTGDSMTPTLLDRDLVLVDFAIIEATPRDGIHVVRMDESLHIKRIAAHFRNDHISLMSDNPMYPTWRNLDRQSVDIVGRVLWFGRNLA